MRPANANVQVSSDQDGRRVVFDALQPVEFLAIRTGHRLTLSVSSLNDPNEPVYTAEFSLRGDPICRTSDGPVRWGMWSGIPAPARNGNCPFFGAVYHARKLGYSPAKNNPRLPEDKVRELWTASMAAGMHAAKLAVSLCDPKALKQARRFLPNLRWFVYSHIVADKSGRLAQLASSCPGAFIFAHALREHGVALFDVAGDACTTIMQSVVDGLPLKRVLDEAIDSWMREAPYEGTDTESHAAWTLVRGASPAKRAQMQLEQRLLIRRAVPGVKSELVWLPPPVAFVPNDIPKGARAIARWFRFAKAYNCYRKANSLDDVQGLALCGFASAHSEQLSALSRELKRSPSNLIGDIADYVVYNNLNMPTRSANPAAIVEATVAWERMDMFCFGRARRSLPPDTDFPPPPVADLEVGPVHLHAMTTPLDLRKEGKEMGHCVATHEHDANSGEAAYFNGTIGKSRVTIETIGVSGKWAVGQARGLQNRDLTSAEYGDLGVWIAELNRVAAHGPWQYSSDVIPF